MRTPQEYSPCTSGAERLLHGVGGGSVGEVAEGTAFTVGCSTERLLLRIHKQTNTLTHNTSAVSKGFICMNVSDMDQTLNSPPHKIHMITQNKTEFQFNTCPRSQPYWYVCAQCVSMYGSRVFMF